MYYTKIHGIPIVLVTAIGFPPIPYHVIVSCLSSLLDPSFIEAVIDFDGFFHEPGEGGWDVVDHVVLDSIL